MRRIYSTTLWSLVAIALVVAAYFAGWHTSAAYRRHRHTPVAVAASFAVPRGYTAIGFMPGRVSGNIGTGERVDILVVEGETTGTLVFDALVMRSNPPKLMVTDLEGTIISTAIGKNAILKFRPTLASGPPDYDAQLSRSHSPSAARAQ